MLRWYPRPPPTAIRGIRRVGARSAATRIVPAAQARSTSTATANMREGVVSETSGGQRRSCAVPTIFPQLYHWWARFALPTRFVVGCLLERREAVVERIRRQDRLRAGDLAIPG